MQSRNILLLLAACVVAQASFDLAVPSTHNDCGSQCQSNTTCCGSDSTCNGNSISQRCCPTGASFCGCISNRAFCSGTVYNSTHVDGYDTFGACFDGSSGATCTYEPSPNLWVVCPKDYQACTSSSFFSCCSPDTYCVTSTYNSSYPICKSRTDLTTEEGETRQPNNNTFYPAAARDSNRYAFVGFGNKFYAFNLPTLSVANTSTVANATFADPAGFNGRYAQLSNGANGQYRFDTSNSSFNYSFLPQGGAPTEDGAPLNPSNSITSGNFTYTFNAGSFQDKATLNKTSANGTVVATFTFAGTHNGSVGYATLRIFQLQNGTLYVVAAQSSGGRGSYDFEYYAFDAANLTLINGPVTLPGTAESGCPVPARSCDVPVLDEITLYNGTVVYTFTEATTDGQVSGPFQVYIVCYDPATGFHRNFFDDYDQSPVAGGYTGSEFSSSSSSSAETASSTASVEQNLPAAATQDRSATNGASMMVVSALLVSVAALLL